MRFVWLVLLILCTFGIPAHAENQLVYFGGGDSATPGDFIFDKSFLNLNKYAQEKSWKSEFYYRKKIPKDASKDVKTNTQVFSKKSFEEKINSLVNDIQNGKISPQDQLLIYVDTHGEINAEGELGFAVDGERFSAASLKKLMVAAEAKGVKLGVVAQNCYGGKLLEYQSDKVCIISGSKPDRISFNIEGDTFTDHLVKSTGQNNLERNYLETRIAAFAGGYATQPMISTPVGRLTDSILSPLKSRIREAPDVKFELPKAICRSSTQGLEIIEEAADRLPLTSQSQYQSDVSAQRKRDFESLQDLVKEYDRLENDLFGQRKYRDKNVCAGTPSKCFSIDSFIETSNALNKRIARCTKRIFFANCDSLLSERKNLDEFEKDPLFQQYISVQKTFISSNEDVSEKLNELARKISAKERSLYNELYQDLSRKTPGSNPCRDFKM